MEIIKQKRKKIVKLSDEQDKEKKKEEKIQITTWRMIQKWIKYERKIILMDFLQDPKTIEANFDNALLEQGTKSASKTVEKFWKESG